MKPQHTTISTPIIATTPYPTPQLFHKEISPAIINLLIQHSNQFVTYLLTIVSKQNIALGLLLKPDHVKLQIKDYNIYQSQKEFHLEEIECVPWISDTWG